MRSKLLIASMLLLLVTASGCLDLFAVPGIAVSPDGSTLYFLAGPETPIGSEYQSSLVALNVSDGSTTTLVEGNEDALISAFAVNPVDGTVAYIKTVPEGAATLEVIATDGSTAVVAELDANSIGTMAAFSPDGNWLAVTIVTLPEGVGDEDFSAETAAAATFGVYLVSGADGSVTLISDTDNSRANTISWSPDGAYLAYNAYVDSNGDGRIQTSGGLDMGAMMGGGGSGSAPDPDLSQIFIYDVASGDTTQIETDASNYGQVFVDESSLAYISLDFAGMMTGDLPGISVYDLGSGESESVYGAQTLLSGIAVSPDGSMVAWTESGSNMGGASSGEETPPGMLHIASTDDFEPTQSVELTGIALPDAPVWWDDSTVLVAGTNILGSLMGTFSMSASFSTDGSSSAQSSDIPPQQILSVTTDGDVEVIYEGVLLNPSFITSLLALADMDMEGLGGS